MNEIVNKLENHFGIHCTSKNASEQDRINVIIKPLLVADCMYGYFYDLKKEDFKFKDKQCYKICKQNIDNYSTWLFSALSIEEKEKLNSTMDDANDFIEESVYEMELAFQKYLDFMPTKQRDIIAKLYTIHVMAKCVCALFGTIKLKHNLLNSFKNNIYEIQKSYTAREYPHKCTIDPSATEGIQKSIYKYMEEILNYEI